jgi:hypothetical protein
MATATQPSGLLVIGRAIVTGLLVGLVAANVWPPLLYKLGMPLAAGVEAAFLGAYIWWARGGGPPKSLKAVRADYFRAGPLSGAQWVWGLIGAFFLAATVNAAIVVLFRLVPYPAAAFHAGYDFSFIPTLPMRWLRSWSRRLRPASARRPDFAATCSGRSRSASAPSRRS